MVVGGDVDASGGWDEAVALAERHGCRCSPRPAAGGSASPRTTRNFQGALPLAIAPVTEALEPRRRARPRHAVFRYYPYVPGRCCPRARGSHVTADPDEAARAPMGDAVVADPTLTIQRAARARSAGVRRGRAAGAQEPDGAAAGRSDPITAEEVFATRRPGVARGRDHRRRGAVDTAAHRTRSGSRAPAATSSRAGGGLGFGLSAAVGVALAQPDRPVVCALGEGSLAVHRSRARDGGRLQVPLTVLVLRNPEYAILKWFADLEQVEGAPGLDLPKLDTAEIADGYGISSRRVEGAEEFESAMREAIASPKPELVEVGVAPGMWLA